MAAFQQDRAARKATFPGDAGPTGPGTEGLSTKGPRLAAEKPAGASAAAQGGVVENLVRDLNFLRGFFAWIAESRPRTKNTGCAMPRPRKHPDDKRRKWDVLNPTPAERAAITRFATDAGMSVSAYLIARGLHRPVAARQDWTEIAHRQARLITLLEQIAQTHADSDADGTPRQVGQVLFALWRIETEIQSWMPTGQGHDPDQNLDSETDR